jgi:Bacterial SH3 domain
MKHCICLGLGVLAIVMAAFAVCSSSVAQTSSADDEAYYVANTRPPDAFLALRTNPASGSGQRIAVLPNGTLLKVLERRGDGWWYVRVLPSGPEGWALSRQGNSVWIECCRTSVNDLRTIPTPDEPVGFKTPSNNIYCQLDESVLRCDIKQVSGSKPPRPRACDLEWGDAFVIEQSGRQGYLLCHGDTVANDALLTLSYGSVWEREGYTCKSEQTGLTCLNGAGHGFSLSRGSQRIF